MATGREGFFTAASQSNDTVEQLVRTQQLYEPVISYSEARFTNLGNCQLSSDGRATDS